MVSSDPDFLKCVLGDCSDIPIDYKVFSSISDLSKFLLSVPKLNLAVVLIIEKNGDAVDAPALREFKLEYPQSFFIALLGSCEQRNHLRLQSLGVQNILLPPFSDVSINNEISTALPNVPQFKRHPDLLRRGQMRVNFLLPNDLNYVLGLNHLISLLLKEFMYPVSDSRINIPLACDEAVTNAILHGNQMDPDKKVNVQIYISHSRFKIRVMDQGPGFDFQEVENPTQGENLLRPSGRGVYLMKSIMDTVTFKDKGRVVEMEKRNPQTK
jgi:serine/threonine-protein kinase RsbW